MRIKLFGRLECSKAFSLLGDSCCLFLPAAIVNMPVNMVALRCTRFYKLHERIINSKPRIKGERVLICFMLRDYKSGAIILIGLRL